ncbi:MAG: alanine racemase [Clostridiales bacterium]|nr:alanine racemase [Clostridiales bacterium]
MDKNILNSLRTWAEVDLSAITYNLEAVKEILPNGVKCAAVIKADAYGHGAVRIAKLLDGKADYFAVAMADEAEELRCSGIKTPILVLSRTAAADVPRLAGYNIETTVSGYEEAAELSSVAAAHGVTVGIHIALDTGMSRIGFACTDKSVDEIAEISAMNGIVIKGIFSHYASADSADLAYTEHQTESFIEITEKLKARGVEIPLRHICNSAGSIVLPQKFDMVREGILLYGIAPSDEVDLSSLKGVKPAMSLRSHVSSVRTLPAGTPISYGCTFVTERESIIATVQAGYADGVPRLLSNRGHLLVRGKRAPIVGRVCMDQLMIDVTDIIGVSVGDTATIIGSDGSETISADEAAALAGTIGYEIVCGISRRVPRVYMENGNISSVSRFLAL